MRVSFLIQNLNTTRLRGIQNQPLFKGEANPDDARKDTFEASIIETKINNYGRIKGKIYKPITLTDMFDNPVPGVILQDISSKNTFYACAKEGENYKGLTRMSFYREEGGEEGGKEPHLYISALFGDSNRRKYFGAGTELLKVAARESQKQGLKGRLELVMTGSYPFYYKNNFRILQNDLDSIKATAVLDYAARRNLNPALFWDEDWSHDMQLDERGAESLIRGERYFDSSKSRALKKFYASYNTNDGDIAYKGGIIDFSDQTDGKTPGKFVIQYLEGGAYDLKQTAILVMTLDTINGEKILTIDDFDCIPPKDELKTGGKSEYTGKVKKELIKAARKISEESGVKFSGKPAKIGA